MTDPTPPEGVPVDPTTWEPAAWCRCGLLPGTHRPADHPLDLSSADTSPAYPVETVPSSSTRTVGPAGRSDLAAAQRRRWIQVGSNHERIAASLLDLARACESAGRTGWVFLLLGTVGIVTSTASGTYSWWFAVCVASVPLGGWYAHRQEREAKGHRREAQEMRAQLDRGEIPPAKVRGGRA